MNKVRVCLINPPHPYLVDPSTQAPLGLLYVATALKHAEVPVEVIDLACKQYDDDLDIPEADIYGITATILDRKSVDATAKAIKTKYPFAKVIVGGPMWLSAEYLNESYIDSIVEGEGEQIIFKIIKDYPNLSPRYIADRIEDLDTLPFPDRDFIENKGGAVFSYKKSYRPGGSIVFLTARGCPFNCAFCSSPGVWNRKVQYRSIENITKEMDHIIETHGITQFRFSDDTLTLSRERLTKLCAEFKKRDIVWRCSVRAKPNDRDLFKMMYDSGCREISPGIESGDQDVLNFLNKGSRVEDNRDVIINAMKEGLTARVLLMCGVPGETSKTVERNIEFLKSVDCGSSIAMTRFVPLPGSAIAKNPRKFKCTILSHNIDDYHLYMWGPEGERKWDSLIKLDDMSEEEINDNIQKMKEFIMATGKSSQWKTT
jgi:anaerobic magnesium-protoporphyrin IX monomethyl ester cyclase